MAEKVRNKKELKLFRTNLRKNMPAPELILWQAIRNGVLGVKFRRQFSIENYILDFYAPSISLALEIDGDFHYENRSDQNKDQIRDKKLARLGIKILRFTNKDVMENLEGVIEEIQKNLPPLNLPLIMGEKGERALAPDLSPSPGERNKQE